MSISVREGEIKPFGKCVFISNERCEAAVTIDVGPRIISLKALGSNNLLVSDEGLSLKSTHPSIKEAYGKDAYYFFGGHRLWWTPERFPETYCPDDSPVEWKIEGDAVRFSVGAQPSGVSRSILLELDSDEAFLTLTQTVANTSGEPRRHAAWGITQCIPGGVAVVPQNTRDCSPLPNRLIAHWPYNSMGDGRFLTGDRYITLRQRVDAKKPFKFGMNNEAGWCGYIVDGYMLKKEFCFDTAACYPDYGCNFESYTDSAILEIEVLSEEKLLAPNESVTLRESWRVLKLIEPLPEPESDGFADAIDRAVN